VFGQRGDLSMSVRSGLSTLTVCLSWSLAGCSWLTVVGPPKGHEHYARFDCTTENVAPGIDVALAASEFIGATILLATVHDSSHTTAAVVGGAAGFVASGIYGVSAGYGFETTAACRKARLHADERERTEEIQMRSAVRPSQPSYPYTRVPAFSPRPPGCSYDTQCKGDRVCDRGRCVAPTPNKEPESNPPAVEQPSPTPTAPGPSVADPASP
jgi:hypothetical protein